MPATCSVCSRILPTPFQPSWPAPSGMNAASVSFTCEDGPHAIDRDDDQHGPHNYSSDPHPPTATTATPGPGLAAAGVLHAIRSARWRPAAVRGLPRTGLERRPASHYTSVACAAPLRASLPDTPDVPA